MSVFDRHAAIRRRIEDACRRAGRAPSEVVLLGASKRQSVATVNEAVEAGLTLFGENRVQEAATKIPVLPLHLEWHLIGPLQSNKSKSAARLFSTVHSLDRPKIIRYLDRDAKRDGRRLEGFVQVNLGHEPSKHGFDPESLVETIAPFSALENLKIIGLMAIPPFEDDFEKARGWFRRLRTLRDQVAARPEWQRRGPWAGKLSMGMSHDFEIAIEEGATHVRVGSALFGERDS